ncbi:MAG: VOC family protein [Rhodospirillaceae bacterium]
MNVALDAGGGWKEAVTLVRDLDQWCMLADQVCGWTLGHRGPVDQSILSMWSLNESTSGEEALFYCGDAAQGFVRFVAFDGTGEQQRVRAGAMPWDTGGIFSLMVRSKDLQGVSNSALNFGWTAVADPISFDYNGRTLANVILRGPDGVSFGMYERVEPPLEGWNHITHMSQPFNCMQIVRDRDATRDFHRDALGFIPFVDNDTRNTEPKDSNFGFPRNLTTEIETKAAIMHPRGVPGAVDRENGRVELIEWNGLEGRDLSDRALPPNLGHIALRWVVADVSETASRITAAGYSLESQIRTATLHPYGKVQVCSVRTPDGVLYEFFQTAA